MGDLNFDSIRFTGHTQAISNFMDDKGLMSAWDLFPVDFTFASMNGISTLDHFVVSNLHSQTILEAGVLHDSENLSGHSPIYLKVDLVKDTSPPEQLHRNPRLNWTKSSQEQRESYSKQLLDFLSVPKETFQCLKCHDSLCNDRNHLAEIDSATRYLMQGLVDSAWSNLESTQGTTGDQASRKFTIPGWNHMVRPYQGESKFWYSIWLSAGKPIHSNVPGVENSLFTLMKLSRNNYHYAVRRITTSDR